MRGKLVLLIMFFSFTVLLGLIHSVNTAGIYEDYDVGLHAVRVLNATQATEGSVIAIYNIILNPETWVLKNISFEFSIKPRNPANIAGIEVLSALNDTNTITTIQHEKDRIRISVKISEIPMKTNHRHYIYVRLTKPDTYDIADEEKVTLTKVKGELILEGEMSFNMAQIQINKAPLPYPEEGRNNGTLVILIVTILLPLAIIAISRKL